MYDKGFELDGVPTYQNLSQALDEETGRLQVFAVPTIEQYSETKRFIPKVENQLIIKVNICTYPIMIILAFILLCMSSHFWTQSKLVYLNSPIVCRSLNLN